MARKLSFFGFGLAVALLAGWVVFPRWLYLQKNQPLDFLHKTHAEKSGVADCCRVPCNSRGRHLRWASSHGEMCRLPLRPHRRQQRRSNSRQCLHQDRA